MRIFQELPSYWGRLFLKFMIPSWRFFDKAGPFFFLEYRGLEAKEAWAQIPSSQEIKNEQNIFRIFLNPKGNLYLAQQGLVERWAFEILENSNKTPASHSTAKFIESLVSHGLKQVGPRIAGTTSKYGELRLRMLQSFDEKAGEVIFYQQFEFQQFILQSEP